MRRSMDTHFYDNHTYSISKEERRYIWSVKRLWELTQTFPTFKYQVSSFDMFEKDIWFCGYKKPTIKSVLNHMERIKQADLRFPIIISEEGLVMDGVHRILRAHIDGLEWVNAVQFIKNPQPDLIE